MVKVIHKSKLYFQLNRVFINLCLHCSFSMYINKKKNSASKQMCILVYCTLDRGNKIVFKANDFVHFDANITIIMNVRKNNYKFLSTLRS